MHMRWAMTILLALALVLSTTGCGDDQVAGAPTVSDMEKERAALVAKQGKRGKAGAKKGKGKNKRKKGPGVLGQAGYAASDKDYFYDQRGKRDPFRTFRFDDDDSEKKDFGPLGDFELGQLELSAVIWDANNPRALILDPGGRSYIIREGAAIGKNNGQVIHIGDNLVLVKETYENFAGERTTKDVELRIRLSQGG